VAGLLILKTAVVLETTNWVPDRRRAGSVSMAKSISSTLVAAAIKQG